ncbi:MAG: DoxX family protein [Rickettsiales bacterium]
MNIASISQLTSNSFELLNKLESFWWLFLRIWIAMIFFKSGLTKIDNFETTVFLFADEYQVPLLPPYFAALSATFFELAMPVLIVLGLATRFAVLPLIIMTAVIEFTYLSHAQHIFWAIVLVGLLLHGAGKLSADHWIKKRF